MINFDLLTIRRDAEQLLRYDGDFLVRESQQPGQFVLTGMQVMEACDWLVLIILTSHWSSGQWEEASATCGSRGSCQVRNFLENRLVPFNPSFKTFIIYMKELIGCFDKCFDGVTKLKINHFLIICSRTRDRTFESVTHLIDYHRNNKLPIISAESALRLDTPVVKMRR